MSTQVTVDGLNSKTTDSTTNNGRCSQILSPLLSVYFYQVNPCQSCLLLTGFLLKCLNKYANNS